MAHTTGTTTRASWGDTPTHERSCDRCVVDGPSGGLACCFVTTSAGHCDVVTYDPTCVAFATLGVDEGSPIAYATGVRAVHDGSWVSFLDDDVTVTVGIVSTRRVA